MGLRINTNIGAITAQRTLNINSRNQATSIERLSTGLRINRGADDPSGLIISDQLRSQISGLKQAAENSQNAANIVSIADQALQEASNLLTQIQDSIVFALNTGAASPDQIAAEQQAVDNAVAAVDRIGATTRYADKSLLNGSLDYQLTGNRPDQLDDLTIRRITFPDNLLTRTFTVNITRNPQQGTIQLRDVSADAGATIRIQGARGVADVSVASGAVATDFARAINSAAESTGVFASGQAGPAGDVTLFSEDFGNSQLIRIEIMAGTVSGTGATLGDTGVFTTTAGPFGLGSILSDRGLDGQVTVDGKLFTGKGRNFQISTASSDFEFKLDPELVPFTVPTAVAFTVGNTGVGFQINNLPRPSDRLELGFQTVSTATLGVESSRDAVAEAVAGGTSRSAAPSQILRGGYLSSLKTGEANDLTNNAKNANFIVHETLNQIGKFRAMLGAVVGFNIQPNIDSLAVQTQNVSAALSNIRDLDFAEESANFTRNQVLFQSSIGVLAAANAIPQQVLTLLRGT